MYKTNENFKFFFILIFSQSNFKKENFIIFWKSSSFFDLERDYEKEPFRSSLPKRVSKDECTTYQYIIPIGENVIMENRYKGGKPATQTKNSFPTSYNIEKPLDLPVVKINTRPKKTANDP